MSVFSYSGVPSGNFPDDNIYADSLSVIYDLDLDGLDDRINYYEDLQTLINNTKSLFDDTLKPNVVQSDDIPHPFKAILIIQDENAEIIIEDLTEFKEQIEAQQSILSDGGSVHFLNDRDLPVSDCLEDRLVPFVRPRDTQDKTTPQDFRIQDSYIHHKSSWTGWTPQSDAENQYVEILFLSRAIKSDKEFNKYDEYAPNERGYYDALFEKPQLFFNDLDFDTPNTA